MSDKTVISVRRMVCIITNKRLLESMSFVCSIACHKVEVILNVCTNKKRFVISSAAFSFYISRTLFRLNCQVKESSISVEKVVLMTLDKCNERK